MEPHAPTSASTISNALAFTCLGLPTDGIEQDVVFFKLRAPDHLFGPSLADVGPGLRQGFTGITIALA